MTDSIVPVPRRRLAAYAVVLRGDDVLLSQLSQLTGWPGSWTLPGGGIDHGEDPRHALVREVLEETGLVPTLGAALDVDSVHHVGPGPGGALEDYQAVRLLFAATVGPDAPEPRVVEVNGSTAAAAWHRVADVRAGRVPSVPLVRKGLDALAAHRPRPVDPDVRRHQRLAAYALLRRDDAVLLTRISARGHHVGSWTLPGGGVDQGEHPRDTLVREVAEETGLRVRAGVLLGVHDTHLTGRAPDGEVEDFHGVHLLFEAAVHGNADVRVHEVDGTTDAVEWVPLARIRSGELPVLDVVHAALDLAGVR